MTLDQFLSLPGSPTAKDFGERCEPPISEASISRIRKGEQNMTRDTILAIIKASGNLVTAEGLVGKAAA
jgi:hypothetical protein